MLTNALPACPHCHQDTYRSGGAHLGSTLSQQSFVCESCEAFVQFLAYGPSGCLLAFIQKSACTGPDQYDGYTFPEAYGKWVDKTLLPTWRHREEAVENFKNLEWRQWLADKFYPEFPDCTDYVPHGNRSFYDLPEAAQAFIKATWHDSFRAGTYLPFPDEIRNDVYPPQAPRITGVHLMVPMAYTEGHGKWTWVSLDHERSATLPVPEDPILRRNREYFDTVWSAVARNIEQEVPPRTETKNGYGGIEPWYTFVLNGATFIVGWRKRVVSIHVESPKAIDVRDIRDLAAADKVTYDAQGVARLVTPDEYEAGLRAQATPEQMAAVEQIVRSFRETHPNGFVMREVTSIRAEERDTANLVVVHAWTLAKTIEYLTILCRAVLLGA